MSSSATLATLRARVLQQVTSASSGEDYYPVTASSLTLTTMRDRVEVVLQDSTNATWSTDDIDEAIRQVLEQYSRRKPQRKIATKNLSSDGREIDISTISNLLRVEQVWCPYDSSDPSHPPNWVHFEVWPGPLLYIIDPTEPSSGDVIRIWYSQEHTLNLLDGAEATTFPVDDESFLVHGAAAFAARFRAIELAESATVDSKVFDRLQEWVRQAMREFSEGLYQRGWRSYAFTYNQDDVDEAIRWALHRLNEVAPHQTVTSIELSAAGREVDISSIASYIDVIRVWWPYDSSDPAYPPRWCDFQLWPGDIVYLEENDEPAIGDDVRIWYTTPHTLNGLDSATTTTISPQDETLIVIGASGFAAQEEVQDRESRYVPRKLREWAEARLREFEEGIHQVARRQAARFSGIAATPTLDRWEDDGSGWN
jgi:hypothetical protein